MKTQIESLSELVKVFCEERDWTQFHNIKDLAIGLSIESSELLQIFLWKNNEEIDSMLKDNHKYEHIQDEMADILFFLLRIAQLNNVDLESALKNKIIKNNFKYPVAKSKGSNKKYTEL